MIAAILPLVPLLAQFIPRIAEWLGGGDAEDVARQVTGAVAAVAGSTDPALVTAAIADPARAGQLAAELARIAGERARVEEDARTARLVATLADISNARATTVALAQANSPIAFLAPCTCALVFLLFAFVVVAEVFGYGSGMSEATRRLLDYLAIAAASYAIGSSAGSAAKDQRLQHQAAPPAIDRPEAPVQSAPRRSLFARRPL